MLRPRRSLIIVPWLLFIIILYSCVITFASEAHRESDMSNMLFGASRGAGLLVRGLSSRRRTTLGCFVPSSNTPLLRTTTTASPILRPPTHDHPFSCTTWTGFRKDAHNSALTLTNRPFPSHGVASSGGYSWNHKSGMRLFGTKCGTLDSVGDIQLMDEQTTLPHLDIQRIKDILTIVRDIIGYPTYDVTLILVDDETMRATNLESRDMDSPTDILSFPFDDDIVEPGNLGEPEFDVPDYYHLGDMFLDVEYVVRQCQQDQTDASSLEQESSDDSDDSDEEYEYVDDDRGVAGTMMTIYDPEERIGLLLVHGMLHLVGYDHIEDDEYEQMITKEDEVLAILKERLKNK